MVDYRTVSWAIARLQQPHDRPFFLAVGLTKPHMPWAVPKHYFDLFPLASIRLPAHLDQDLDDVPAAARSRSALRDHVKILRTGRWRDAIQAYLAASNFSDEQVGRLVDALDASPSRDNTVVVLWSDNGFHFGQKQHWRKFTLWEESTRVPLVWVAPGVTSPGTVSSRAVELSSIYPTLCDLAGLPVPPGIRSPSLLPLLRSPAAQWRHPALMTGKPGSTAVRLDEWRYIRYAEGGDELYDLSNDPYEWRNRSGDPSLATTQAALEKSLPVTFAKAAPAIVKTRRQWHLPYAAAVLLIAATALAAVWTIRRRRLRSRR